MRLALASGFYVITSLIAAPLAAQEIKAVASFSILGDFLKEVGGERVSVQTLVGPDGDAHAYEPRPADAVALARADAVFVNGLGFEGFIDRLVAASGTKAPIFTLSEGVAAIENAEDQDEHDHHDHDHEGHDHGPLDPHAWQSIANARIYVANAAKGLCQVDAEGCAAYEANAARYDSELAGLEAQLSVAFAALPQDRRAVIVSHNSFAYFGRAYGLTFLPAQNSTESEASAAEIAALIRQAREDKAGAIFVENVSNPRLVESIAAEAGLKLGGELYSDALTGPKGGAPSYLALMRANAEALLKALRP